MQSLSTEKNNLQKAIQLSYQHLYPQGITERLKEIKPF